MAIIQVNNLIKRYRKATRNAVDGVSFEVQPGEFFALLGPNGAGKTTTISILTTTLAKTSGEINIAGFDLDRQSSQVRSSIGIIFQNPSLDLNLTAEENIRFHTLLYGMYPFRPSFGLMPKAYQNKVMELAKILGIEKEIFKQIKTFSGGMKRKLEIIRSLMHNPKVLFLDEPTSGLDPESRRNLWEYLQTVREKQSITIFLTTHYLEEAEKADQVCIINNGKIIAQGSPEKIKKHLVSNYLLMSAKDMAKLKQELNHHKLEFIEQADLLKVDLDKKTSQAVIQMIKTPLTTLQTHTPTLEDAYLEIISQKDNKEDN